MSEKESGPVRPLPPLQMMLRWYAGDTEVPVELELPAEDVEPQAVLPALQKLVNEVVAVSVKALEGTGRSVTCAAGCGACCRQIVPIADFEAHAIAELIERMPEARREHVRERFADAERRLAARQPLDEIIDGLNGPDRYELAVAYFRYGVACPFLENESCSIYEDRPLICREYLVHTPVERCSRVGEPGIGVVPVTRSSKALYRMSTMHARPSETRVPLSLVPYWVARHPKDFETTNGSDWMLRFVTAMEQSDDEEEQAWQKAKAKKQADDAVSPDGSMIAPLALDGS